ncbi:MAG: hypothetical protein JOY71_06100 [Acetobacteraceae bacterium]|nr:hypothetical protein [Acetobacteraceae bacterium]MBV8521689.1 hypothetical protein [Acetobacteraceae bacterium]
MVTQVNEIPLMQIVDDIHHTSEQFAKLSDSPELTNGLSNLDRSMANIAQVTGQSASGLGRSWPRNLGTRSESSQGNAALGNEFATRAGGSMA